MMMRHVLLDNGGVSSINPFIWFRRQPFILLCVNLCENDDMMFLKRSVENITITVYLNYNVYLFCFKKIDKKKPNSNRHF